MVTSTKHIALAVSEELDLQHRLLVQPLPLALPPSHTAPRTVVCCRQVYLPGLRASARHTLTCLSCGAQDDLDDAVEHTGGRMQVAQNRLKVLIRKSNDCKAR